MNKFISIEKAVAQVKEGMTVMVGGFLANGTPNAIVDALAQSGVKNLTLICNDTAYPDRGVGQLIANKQVKKLIVSHIGTNPCTSEQMNSGELDIEFVPRVHWQNVFVQGCGIGRFSDNNRDGDHRGGGKTGCLCRRERISVGKTFAG